MEFLVKPALIQPADVRLQLWELELQRYLVPQKVGQDLIQITRWWPGDESGPKLHYHVANRAV
jgi:hypothetical protein